MIKGGLRALANANPATAVAITVIPPLCATSTIITSRCVPHTPFGDGKKTKPAATTPWISAIRLAWPGKWRRSAANFHHLSGASS
jgi:hypothetical protein